jgi:hypothetical protein
MCLIVLVTMILTTFTNLTKDIHILSITLLVLKKVHCLVRTVGLNFL